MSALVCSGTGSITTSSDIYVDDSNPKFAAACDVPQKALWGVFASPVRQNRRAASVNPPQTYTQARSLELANFGLNELRLHTDYLLPLCIFVCTIDVSMRRIIIILIVMCGLMSSFFLGAKCREREPIPETTCVTDIPSEVEFIVVYTQPWRARTKAQKLVYGEDWTYAPYVIRYENNEHWAILQDESRSVKRQLRTVPANRIQFRGFEIDHIGNEKDDVVSQRAAEVVKALPGHDYAKRDNPVYYYKRVHLCKIGELTYKAFEEWVDKSLSTELPEGIEAFCFNLYEDVGNNWSVEIIGASSFDENDEDWACDEIFDTRMTPLVWNSDKSWEDILSSTTAILKDYLEKGKYAPLLRSKKGVGIGFVDGDLVLL